MFTDDQRQLLLDLLEAHRINLEGHLAALIEDPFLMHVSHEGEELTREQIELVERTVIAVWALAGLNETNP